jgi:CubicO group peptidase (beta-lactamase class C family)
MKCSSNYLAIPLFLILFFYGCKENEIFPDVIEDMTGYADLTDATVVLKSEILTPLSGSIEDYGHAWAEGDKLPDLADSHTQLRKGGIPTPFAFESIISGLKRGTFYTARSYVKTSGGIIYGSKITFTTKSDYFDRFAAILEDSLKNRDFGYSFLMFRDGKVVGSGQGGLQARAVETGGERSVSMDSKMQIASMTKTVVAAAFLKLAEEKGLTLQDTITGFLPHYWTIGPNVGKITFGHLLLHQSGIIGLGNDCRNGALLENAWQGLQQLMEKGVEEKNIGSSCYQNANFGLFRVLIPGILGYEFTDENTDMLATARIFEEYLKTAIFEKSGVSPGNLFKNSMESPTYGYDVPFSGTPGFDPGDFGYHSGGYGIYLSAQEAGALYGALFDDVHERVLKKEQKDAILVNGYGSYSAVTPDGRFSYHDGWWHLGLEGGKPKGFRTVWMKCPDNLIVVLLVNGLRSGDGLFPLRAFQYQDITSYLLWAYSRLAGETAASRTAAIDYHQYLTDPQPH